MGFRLCAKRQAFLIQRLLQYVFQGSLLNGCQETAAQHASDRPVHPTLLRQDPTSLPHSSLIYIPLLMKRRALVLVYLRAGNAPRVKVKTGSAFQRVIT